MNSVFVSNVRYWIECWIIYFDNNKRLSRKLFGKIEWTPVVDIRFWEFPKFCACSFRYRRLNDQKSRQLNGIFLCIFPADSSRIGNFHEFQSSVESRNIREFRNISKNVKYLAVTGEHLGKPEISERTRNSQETRRISRNLQYLWENREISSESWNSRKTRDHRITKPITITVPIQVPDIFGFSRASRIFQCYAN